MTIWFGRSHHMHLLEQKISELLGKFVVREDFSLGIQSYTQNCFFDI